MFVPKILKFLFFSIEPVTLYRVYGGGAGKLSHYWTSVSPTGTLQARIDSALLPEFRNTAEKVSKIQVPAGERFFCGAVAEQTNGVQNLMGGGQQIYIEYVDPTWLIQ